MIHLSAHIVFWSQEVRRSLDEINEEIDESMAGSYIKIILKHAEKKPQQSQHR